MSLARLIGGRFPPNKSEGGYRRRINLHCRVFMTQQQKYFTACAYACAAILTGAELNNSAAIGFETLAVSQSCDFLLFLLAMARRCLCHVLTVVSWWCFCCVQPLTLREHAVDASHEQLVFCWTAVLENHILVQIFFHLFKITVCVMLKLLNLFCHPMFWRWLFLPREPVVMFAASKSQQCWQPMIEWTVQSPLSSVWDPS